MSLLRLLWAKTYSKRGFTWTGRLLSSVLLTMTHTYPTENKFVNPDEWASEGMIRLKWQDPLLTVVYRIPEKPYQTLGQTL
jgi:hypothetical protein